MVREVHIWTSDEMEFLEKEYPQKGLAYCCGVLGLKSSQVRSKASLMGLKQDRNSEFFKDWQARAAKSKVGKKRPKHSAAMKKRVSEGNWKNPMDSDEAREKNKKPKWKDRPHPKGAFGMKHSEESKSKISEKAKQMWKNMPEEKRDDYSKRASVNGQKTAMNRLNATWKAAWREIGGKRKFFRSRWEANYARYLEWLKANKQISEWEHEPETFWFDGIKRGVMSYLPDFRVTELSGSIVYHEVKGWMDDRSKTKIKRMAKYHPDVKLLVIDSKAYKSIEKKVKPFINDWE